MAIEKARILCQGFHPIIESICSFLEMGAKFRVTLLKGYAKSGSNMFFKVMIFQIHLQILLVYDKQCGEYF